MGGRLDTLMQGNNVGMTKLFEDPNLRVKVVFDFALELTSIDCFDSDKKAGAL